MNCNSKNCKYFMLDECIRKNVTIEGGKCPFYTTMPLNLYHIMHFGVRGNWVLADQNDNKYTANGHLLDVCQLYYDESIDYFIVSPSSEVFDDVESYEGKLPTAMDLSLYLRFIDNNIYSMYLEEFMYTWMKSDHWEIEKLDCGGHFVHLTTKMLDIN